MISFIAKQPNGKYCRFTSMIDSVSHWNFTREEYLNNITGTVTSLFEAIDIMDNHIAEFEEVLKHYKNSNMNKKQFNSFLKEVGYKMEGSL